MLNKIIKTILATAVIATAVPAVPITSITATQGPVVNADGTGGSGFTYPTFNGGAANIDQVREDLNVLVRYNSSQAWVKRLGLRQQLGTFLGRRRRLLVPRGKNDVHKVTVENFGGRFS